MRTDKIFFLLIPALFFHIAESIGQADFPFELRPKMDIIAIASGTMLSSLGYVATERVSPFTEADILSLDKSEISPRLDKKATEYWSIPISKASDIGLGLSGVSAASLTFFQKRKKQAWFTLSVMGTEAFLWTYGLTAVTKGYRKRSRPFSYNSKAPLGQKLSKDARQSFFSGHSSMAAAGCVFASEVFIATHPKSKWKNWIRAGGFVFPATVGYLRYRSGKHFPTDVVTGLVVGSLIGWAVPRLHLKTSSTSDIKVFPTENGIALIWN